MHASVRTWELHRYSFYVRFVCEFGFEFCLCCFHEISAFAPFADMGIVRSFSCWYCVMDRTAAVVRLSDLGCSSTRAGCFFLCAFVCLYRTLPYFLLVPRAGGFDFPCDGAGNIVPFYFCSCGVEVPCFAGIAFWR